VVELPVVAEPELVECGELVFEPASLLAFAAALALPFTPALPDGQGVALMLPRVPMVLDAVPAELGRPCAPLLPVPPACAIAIPPLAAIKAAVIMASVIFLRFISLVPGLLTRVANVPAPFKLLLACD
jgi:hypothetical protein